jgi:hypothetical protein
MSANCSFNVSLYPLFLPRFAQSHHRDRQFRCPCYRGRRYRQRFRSLWSRGRSCRRVVCTLWPSTSSDGDSLSLRFSGTDVEPSNCCLHCWRSKMNCCNRLMLAFWVWSRHQIREDLKWNSHLKLINIGRPCTTHKHNAAARFGPKSQKPDKQPICYMTFRAL